MIELSAVDSIPLWLIGVILIAVLSAAIELGYQLGTRVASEKGLSKHPVEAAVSTALLGLLTFMTAFTFNAAVSRYAKLRNLGINDANLAQSLFLLTDFLQEEDIPKAKSLVREYVEVRAKAINEQDSEQIQSAIARSSAIQQELWQIGAKDQTSPVRIYSRSLTKLIENDATRQATALVNRLPGTIWFSLGTLAVLSMALLGLSSGLHGRRSRLVASVFITAYALVFVLIVDLDRPFRALFKLGDPAAERALQSMN